MFGLGEEYSALDLSVFEDYWQRFGSSDLSFSYWNSGLSFSYEQLVASKADVLFIPGGRVDTYCFPDSSLPDLKKWLEEGHDIILSGMGKLYSWQPLASTNNMEISWDSQSEEITWYDHTSTCNLNLASIFGLKLQQPVRWKAMGNFQKDVVFSRVHNHEITQDFPEELTYSTYWSGTCSDERWDNEVETAQVVFQAYDYRYVVTVKETATYRATFLSNEVLDIYSMRRGTQYLRKKLLYNALTYSSGESLSLPPPGMLLEGNFLALLTYNRKDCEDSSNRTCLVR